MCGEKDQQCETDAPGRVGNIVQADFYRHTTPLGSVILVYSLFL